MNGSDSEKESTLSRILDSVRSSTAASSENRVSNETGHADDGEGTDAELPLDVAFEILKNRRRRMVLEELAAANEEVTISDLSEAIAARENDKPVSAITSKERKRVYVGLYQAHLPKMDEAGVVVYNQDRGLITAGPHADLLDRHLNSGPTTSPSSRSRRLLLTTALLGLLVVGSLLVETVAGAHPALVALVALFVLSLALTVRRLTRA